MRERENDLNGKFTAMNKRVHQLVKLKFTLNIQRIVYRHLSYTETKLRFLCRNFFKAHIFLFSHSFVRRLTSIYLYDGIK